MFLAFIFFLRFIMIKLDRAAQFLFQGGDGDPNDDYLDYASDADNAEDLDAKYSRMSSGVRTRWITPGPHRRARSESPYGKPGMGRKLKSTKLFDQARRDVDSLGPIGCRKSFGNCVSDHAWV